MAEAAKFFTFGRREDPELNQEEEERRQLMESLAQTRRLINQAYGAFNSTDDSDLIESYVFEIKSLYSRYSYLLRQIKQLGGDEVPAGEEDIPAPLENVQSL